MANQVGNNAKKAYRSQGLCIIPGKRLRLCLHWLGPMSSVGSTILRTADPAEAKAAEATSRRPVRVSVQSLWQNDLHSPATAKKPGEKASSPPSFRPTRQRYLVFQPLHHLSPLVGAFQQVNQLGCDQRPLLKSLEPAVPPGGVTMHSENKLLSTMLDTWGGVVLMP